MAIKAVELVAEFAGDSRKFDRTYTEVDRKIRQMATSNPAVRMGYNGAAVESGVASARSLVSGIDGTAQLGLDTSDVESGIDVVGGTLEDVEGTAELGLDASAVDSGVDAAGALLNGLEGTAELGVDLTDVEAGASTASAMLDGIEATAVLGVDTGEIDSAIASVQGQLDGLSSMGGSPGQALGEGFSLGGAAAGGAIGDLKGGISGLTGVIAGVGLSTMLTGFVGDAHEAAQATATLGSQVRVTGAESWTSADALQDHAARLQELTGASDEQVMAAQAQLLSFKNVRNEVGAGSDVYTRATAAAGDMAAVTGTDLVSANTMLGKALNDPIKGIGAMARAGVQFTAQQKEQITALVESGNILDAQKVILGELEGQYGGTAAAQHAALGSTGELRVAMGELSETVGGAVVPAVDWLSGVLGPAVRWFSSLPGPVQSSAVLLGSLGAVALLLAPQLESAGRMVGDLTSKMRGGEASTGRFSGTLSKLGGAAAIAGGIFLVARALDTVVTSSAQSGLGLAEFQGQLLDIEQSGDGAAGVARLLGGDVERLARQFEIADTSIGSMVNVLDGVSGKSRKEAVAAIDELDAGLTALAQSGDAGREAAAGLFSQIADVVGIDLATERLNGYQGTLAEVDVAQRLAGDSAGALPGSVGDVAGAMGEAKMSAEDMAEAFDEAVDSMSSLHAEMTAGITTEISYRDAIADLSASLTENGRTFDINSDAGRRNLETALGLGDQIVTLGQQYIAEGMSVAEATDKTNTNVEALGRQLVQAGFTRGAVDQLIGTMKLTPKDISTLFHTPGLYEAQTGTRTLGDVIHSTPRSWATLFAANTGDARYAVGVLNRDIADLPRQVNVAITASYGGMRGVASAIASAVGDGPGGPMAPRGGKALDRVRAVLPSYPGLRITSTYRTPAHNRRVGGSPTSYHMDANNPAVDVAGPPWQMNRFYGSLGMGWREKIHEGDHVHVAHTGGRVENWWPTVPGLGRDERPAILQVGEEVIAKGQVFGDSGGSSRPTMGSRSFASPAPAPVFVSDGGTETHLHFHGPVVGGEAGMRELARKVTGVQGTRSYKAGVS